MNKVGRNDPCPCGSGLKYKFCHGKAENIIDATELFRLSAQKASLDLSETKNEPQLTYQEQHGTPNAATPVTKKMMKELENQVFNSRKDAEAFIENFSNEYNNSPLEMFMGISPFQMSAMMAYNRDFLDSFLTVGVSITEKDFNEITILKECYWLLNYLNKNGPQQLTSSLYLSPKLVNLWYDACFIKKDIYGFVPIRPKKEKDSFSIMYAHGTLLASGLIEYNKNMVCISDEGLNVLKEKNWNFFYRSLFWGTLYYQSDKEKYFISEHDDFFDLIILFLIYAIKKIGKNGVSGIDFLKAIKIAFPQEKWDQDEDIDIVYLFLHVFSLGARLGLLSTEHINIFDKSIKLRDQIIINSSFYDRALKWDV